MMADAWQPAVTLSRDWVLKDVGPSEYVTMRGGQTRVLEEPWFQTLDISLDWLTRDESVDELIPILSKARAVDILAIKDFDEGLVDESTLQNPLQYRRDYYSELIYGLCTSERMVREPIHSIYKQKIMMRERRP